MKKLFLFLMTVTAFSVYAESKDDSAKDADLFVNVTAARELKETASIPAAVTVITKEDMAGHSVTEALSIYSGIGFSSTANAETTASPVIRGFSENSHGRVLVLLDGVKLNNPDMSGINWLSIPEDRIERIEVIKGANSALYGNNAVAAVINIITEEPVGATSVTADLNGGSFDTWSRSVSASAGDEKLAITVSAKDEKTDGWRDRTGYESTDFSGMIKSEPVDKLEMSVSLLYSDSEYQMPGYITKVQYDDDPTQADNKSDFAVNSFTQITSSNLYSLNDKTDLNLKASYSNKKNSTDMVSWLSYFDTNIDTYSINPSLIIDFPELLWGSSINTGIDYNYEKGNKKNYTDSTRTTISAGSNANVDIIRNSIGFYFRGESYLLDNLVFSLSGRYETSTTEAEFKNDSSLDEGKTHNPFVYGAGLSFIFAENSKAYFSYNKLFRYPFFDEQVNYAGLWPDGYIDDLDPEEGDNFELGLEYNNYKYAQGGVNLFYMLLDDEIAPDNVEKKNVNLDKTVHYGAESYLTLSPVDIFTTRFNYNYTVAEFRDGDFEDNSLTLVPKHTYSIIPEVNAFECLKLYAEFAFTDEMYMNNDNDNDQDKTDSYFLTNTGLSLSKKYNKSDIKIYLDIKNLFDVKHSNYTEYAFWLPGEKAYYPGSGREITVGSSVSF